MPNHVDGVLVHAMSGTELSRVRTELYPLRILPTVPPHPVQPNRQSSGHGHLGNAFLPTHRQMHVPSPPVRFTTRPRLGLLLPARNAKELTLLADVPKPLMAGTGVLARNQSHIAADLLAALEPLRSSDDQHEGQCRQRSYARVGHQPQHFGPFLRFLLDGGR
jgi:hypothetical protein